LVGVNARGKDMNWHMIWKNKLCLKFLKLFSKFTNVTSDASRIEGKDYAINKEDHELPMAIVIDISP
jgi:hypothetical protein